LHVVCKWLGNSVAVATKHYLQTTDAHFDEAIAEETGALHKAVQSPPVMSGKEEKQQLPESRNSAECDPLRDSTGVQRDRPALAAKNCVAHDGSWFEKGHRSRT